MSADRGTGTLRVLSVAVTARSRQRGQVLGLIGVVAAFGWSILRAGPTVTPSLDALVAAAQAWPQRLPGEFEAFYADSPLGLLVARAVGSGSTTAYLWTSALALVLVACCWALWAWLNAPSSQRWRAARLAVLSPVVGVLAAWLGFYDPWTMLAWAVVLFAWLSGSRALLAVSGGLLGFQHMEHGLLGLAALLLVWVAVRPGLPDRLRATNPGWAAIGVVAGKAVLLLVLVSAGSSASGRTSWLGTYLADWTKVAVNTGPMLVWSLFAGSWAIVVAFWLADSSRRTRTLLAGALIVGLVATLLSGDRPRVFVLVMAPALLLLTIAYLQRREGNRTELRLVETVVWLAPAVTLWGSEVVYANVVDQLVTTWRILTG
jgi:hypothetical protein